MEYLHLTHNIAPVWDENCTVLILGSFPSVKSRECEFFYAHRQNRFWRVLSALFGDQIGDAADEKRSFLLTHHIALWDVVAECDVRGSSDAAIKNVVPNDIRFILDSAPIAAIYTNGATSKRLYDTHILPTVGRAATRLPSTSPANAAWSFDSLCEAWRVIAECDFL